MIVNNNMKEEKVFVYKLIISQLHYDGYGALALLMEQMLLSSRKVQPSDCLTQLLNICRTVSVADNELLIESPGEDKMLDVKPPLSREEEIRKLISQAKSPTLDLSGCTDGSPSDVFIESLSDPNKSPGVGGKTTNTDIQRPTPLIPTSNFLPSLPSPLQIFGFSSPTDPLLNSKSPVLLSSSDNTCTQTTGEISGTSDNLQDVVRALSNSTALSSSPASLHIPSSNAWSGNILTQIRQNKNRTHKLKNCPVCRKVLVASSLYLHMKIHTGEKNYICEHCCKKFLLKHHLHSHLKICPSRRDKAHLKAVSMPFSVNSITTTNS